MIQMNKIIFGTKKSSNKEHKIWYKVKFTNKTKWKVNRHQHNKSNLNHHKNKTVKVQSGLWVNTTMFPSMKVKMKMMKKFVFLLILGNRSYSEKTELNKCSINLDF